MPPTCLTRSRRTSISRWRARVVFIIVALAAISCLRTDRVIAPSQREPVFAADLGGGSCGASCVLVENSGPLWSAIVNPDSSAIPVSIADIRFAPAVGDSIVLQLSGDSALISGISPAELVDVSDGTSHVIHSLAGLTPASVVWKFASTDTTTLHVTLNRALSSVGAGSIVLTSTSSAVLVSAVRPWVAGNPSPSGIQLSKARSLASHLLTDVNPACGGETDIAISSSGSYCGGAATFFPAVGPADAFMGLGATFQSLPPGHGVSHEITVVFNPPVSSVTVTTYDPTFVGNTMTAFNDHGGLIAADTIPGSGTP